MISPLVQAAVLTFSLIAGRTGVAAQPQPQNFFRNWQPFSYDAVFKQIDDIQKNSNTYAMSSSNLNSNAKAESSLVVDETYGGVQSTGDSVAQLQKQAQDNYGFASAFGGFGPAYGGFDRHRDRFMPNFDHQFGNFDNMFAGFKPDYNMANMAFAGGSVGPGGHYQTAAVYPENPGVPNVINKFGPPNAGPDGKGNYYSIFTSATSMTEDVDGKPVTKKHSSTTINDNGKISSYRAHYP